MKGAVSFILGTSTLRALWAPACQAKGDVYRAAYVAIDAWMHHFNYGPRAKDTGAYNCRHITAGVGWSLHAFGPGSRFRFWNAVTIAMSLAVDVNWQSNPYGLRLVTDMPPAMRTAIKAVRTRNGKQVWGWGGDYRVHKDCMHWEIVCSPADLATGIDPATLPGTVVVPKDPNEGRPWHSFSAPQNDHGLYAAGFRNDEVVELELLLMDLGYKKVTPTGHYDPTGPAVAAVVNLKAKADWRTPDGKRDRSSAVSSVFIDTVRKLAAAA